MIIDNNPKELEAMEAFHRGDRQEGLRLQEEFASEFREEYKNKDHCPCKKSVPLSWELQRVRCHSQGAPGACSQLHEADDQSKNQAAVRTDRTYHFL